MLLCCSISQKVSEGGAVKIIAHTDHSKQKMKLNSLYKVSILFLSIFQDVFEEDEFIPSIKFI